MGGMVEGDKGWDSSGGGIRKGSSLRNVMGKWGLVHVVGFAPAGDGCDGGVELQWNYGLESKKKRLKEQDFLENNSQISSLDFLQARSVSTGLGLSLDNGRLASSGDSPFRGLIADEIDRELQRHDAEIDRFLKIQADRLRQEVIEKVQANRLQTVSYVEEKVLSKLREKNTEMENINKKNMELELRIEQLAVEAGAWQRRAHYNESMINTLKFNLQQVYAQSRDSKGVVTVRWMIQPLASMVLQLISTFFARRTMKGRG
ncbi:S-ribonuclease binding protein 1 [Actinidia rufa]|uniref:S-ribonuclease binding protein 1 n=1 Tax=Actinidia rufa TaxID=165716 RepID=A0A7J0D9V3_9ERIC|nr:S-ribonuclease binding protein 1 [Actinidia rufa]